MKTFITGLLKGRKTRWATLAVGTALVGLLGIAASTDSLPMVPPGISRITNHTGAVVGIGATVRLQVWASGTSPVLQWCQDGLPLAGKTATTLTLSDVQITNSGLYTVVVTNYVGSVTSSPVSVTVTASPQIQYTAALQHQAVDIGSNTSFAVTAYGAPPFAFQWRRDGQDLPGQTNATLPLVAAQAADEGDYTVVVTNLAGAVTSESARLWVTPRATNFIKENFTNALGRLPYFYYLPTNYSAARTYAMWFNLHGGVWDENKILTNATPGWLGLAQYPSMKTFASYRQQEREPTLVLWPTRRAGDGSWTDTYLRQASALLDQFMARFSVDTNRVFLIGHSEGVHAAWDMIPLRPKFFSAAGLTAGWQGNAPANAVLEVPTWVWCAADDDYGQLPNTQALVSSLRRAGANLIYTEYNTGAHRGGIGMGHCTPVVVDWLLAQRRGVAPTNGPLVSITNPTIQAALTTGATNISLAGSAAALGRDVTCVTWTNFVNNVKGVATGTNLWSVTGIPLVASKTNVIAVVATTTSWAPYYGGNTSFNDTLTVIQSPIRATLTLQGTEALLTWTGGDPPYRVQQATDLAVGDWTDYLPDATPPVALPPTGQAAFYRIVGW